MVFRHAHPADLGWPNRSLPALGFLAVALLFWGADREALRGFSPAAICGLLGLSALNFAARALRWHSSVRHLGLCTGLWINLRHYLAGLAMVMTPARIGEVIRLRWLQQRTGWPIARTAPLLLLDRAADLVALAVLLALSAMVSRPPSMLAWPLAVSACVLGCAILQPAIWTRGLSLVGPLARAGPRLYGRLRTAARGLEQFCAPGVIASGLGLGLAGWFAEGVAFHLVLCWLDQDLGLPVAVSIFAISTLAGGALGTPGGLGGAEVRMVALLTAHAVPVEVSLAGTALIRLTTLGFATALGAMFLPFAERGGRRSDA